MSMNQPEKISSEQSSESPRPAAKKGLSIWIAVQNILSIAVITATLFTLWTPSRLFSDQTLRNIIITLQRDDEGSGQLPTSTPPIQQRIGIVAGHWGNDSGAVCPDGTTEVETNLRIASLVKEYLNAEGIEVDLLQEFDRKLYQYRAIAVVSIHNDSCDYVGDTATGYKVSAAVANSFPEKTARLTDCLINRYERATGLSFHANTITPDMTSYHAFNEIYTDTPAAIIETGFLNLDRVILTKEPERVARGVADGILCFVRNEPINKEGSAQ